MFKTLQCVRIPQPFTSISISQTQEKLYAQKWSSSPGGVESLNALLSRRNQVFVPQQSTTGNAPNVT